MNNVQLELIEMIDRAKEDVVDPVELLQWVKYRVVLNNIPNEEWDKACEKAKEVMLK